MYWDKIFLWFSSVSPGKYWNIIFKKVHKCIHTHSLSNLFYNFKLYTHFQ
jgi:hypothetical protein